MSPPAPGPATLIMTTRTKYQHFLIDSATEVLKDSFITSYREDDSLDIGSSMPFSGPVQLPTKMQALKLFWFIKDEVGRFNTWSLTKGKVLGIVARVIKHYWDMAGYETVTHSSICKLIKNIVTKYETLLKSKNKEQPKAKSNREAFLADMRTCLNIGKAGLRESLMMDRVRVNLDIAAEDVSFLDDQLGPRIQAMSHKVDKEFARRKAANLKRKSSSVPQSGPSSAKSPSNAKQTEDDEDDEDDEEEAEQVSSRGDNDEDYVDNSRKEKRSDRITVTIPRNIFMSPELISSLDRTKTSDRGTMRILAPVFKTFETEDGKRLDLEELVLSKNTIWKVRQEQRNKLAEEAKAEFKLYMPPLLSLGWDGKLIMDMLNEKHEMESIVVCGAPRYTEGKIIDIVELTDEDGRPTSTGLAQADAVFNSMEEWGVTDRIAAFNFDTTASNTGINSGAAIRLNYRLNRPVLYLACRHHVFDLLAKNTFYKVVGYDPSPDVLMFKRMKDVFPTIDTTGDFMMFDIDNKDELIELFTNILTKENVNGELFVRQDYRELAEIALVMVGGELPEGRLIKWRPPGAAHKARFMAFCLCSLKILAFSHLQEVRNRCFSKKVDKQLVFEEETLQNLWRWGQYAVKFYVPQFLLASLGRDAPSNDLNLYKSLLQYREVDEELANSALDTLARHRWYLAEHVVPFAFFSDNVTQEEKAKMAEKLLTLERDPVPSLGLPEFPEVTEVTELVDLVTSKTWQFFDIVKSDPSWLTKSVSEWEFDQDYNEVKYFVSTVKVVNDSCERAVAMATEYGNILTKDSQMRRKIFQIVEHNRKHFPDCNKKTLGK